MRFGEVSRRANRNRKGQRRRTDEEQIPHIERAIRMTPWAIMPAKLEAIIDLIGRRASGEEAAVETQATIRSMPMRNTAVRAGQVAILPLYDTITQRANLLTQFSGGTSTEVFRGMFRQAMNDPLVKGDRDRRGLAGRTIYGVESCRVRFIARAGRSARSRSPTA